MLEANSTMRFHSGAGRSSHDEGQRHEREQIAQSVARLGDLQL